MVKRLITIFCGGALCLLAACAIVQTLDIQQGNVVDEAMLQQLHLGMSKQQALFVMGMPLLKDPFHKNRWDYEYYLRKDNVIVSHYRITLYFDDKGTLSRIDKHMKGKKATTADLERSGPPSSSSLPGAEPAGARP